MPASASGLGAPRDDDVGGALDQLDDVLDPVERAPVEGRHELVLGVERDLGEPGVGAPGLGGVDTELGGQHHEGGLGGVTDHRAVRLDDGVAVEGEAQRQPGEVRDGRAGDRPDATRGAVPLTVDGEPGA
jgi:hypothetical protein